MAMRFKTQFKNIYHKDLEHKIEHQGNHTSFLDLYIKIEDTIFVYKLSDKRYKSPFFIVRMLRMSSNIPSTIFHGSIFSELLRKTRCTLRIDGFLLRTSNLFTRMISQAGNRETITKQLKQNLSSLIDYFLKIFKNLKQYSSN